MSKEIDLNDGDAVKIKLNGQVLNIKSNTSSTHFVISSLDNELCLIPDARNKIFISAEKQKTIKQ